MGRMLSMFRRSTKEHLDLWLVLLIGIFLRMHYGLRTLYSTRAYDWHGHQEYVDFVMNNYALPGAGTMWESHQSPLYYVIAAIWTNVSMALGRPEEIWADLQLLSILISILSLFAAAWVIMIAFPRKDQETTRMLAIAIVAVMPGTVYFASRITNDGMALLGLTVFTGFLLRWWRSGRTKDWLWCCILAALCLLIKLNGGIFCLATLCICVPLRRGMTVRRAAGYFAILAGAVTLLFGWYVVLRMLDPYYQRMFFSTESLGLNKKLMMPHRWTDFVQFSPVRVLGVAFNDPWTDFYHRRYFWEYLFKSVFTGEWRFNDFVALTRTILAGGMFALLLAITGCARTLRDRATYAIPLLATIVTATGFLMVFRWLHNAGCNQDYRFVPNIVVPLAIFCCIGIDALPGRLRIAARAVMVGFCCACAALILSLTGF